MRLFCVCVALYIDSGLATGLLFVQGVLPTVYRIKKLKKQPRPNKGLYSQIIRIIIIIIIIIITANILSS
jgi:hypothetical protein